MELRNGTVVGAGVLHPESRAMFEEGVRLTFQRWTALCLAIENEWGGPSSREKAGQLLSDTIQWFYRKREHYADELEDELADAIEHDFNVIAEDNSPQEISDKLVAIYQECLQGNFTTVLQLRAAAASGAAQSRQQQVDRDGTVVGMGESSSSDEDGEDGDDQEMDEAPTAVPIVNHHPQDPVVDADGFTMVQTRRRGRR